MAKLPRQDVVLKLTTIDELFNAPDVNPFSGNEIDVLGEAALMRAARRMLTRRVRHWHEARLVIQLPPDQITPDLQTQTQAAIHRYCAAKIEDNRLTIHLSRIRSAIAEDATEIAEPAHLRDAPGNGAGQRVILKRAGHEHFLVSRTRAESHNGLPSR